MSLELVIPPVLFRPPMPSVPLVPDFPPVELLPPVCVPASLLLTFIVVLEDEQPASPTAANPRINARRRENIGFPRLFFPILPDGYYSIYYPVGFCRVKLLRGMHGKNGAESTSSRASCETALVVPSSVGLVGFGRQGARGRFGRHTNNGQNRSLKD